MNSFLIIGQIFGEYVTMKTESKFETHLLLAKHLKTFQFNWVNLFDELIENLFHSILK